jgi:hypothetical protein
MSYTNYPTEYRAACRAAESLADKAGEYATDEPAISGGN